MNHNKWTIEEITLLKNIYEKASWEEIKKEIPRHEESSIKTKAYSLKLPKKLFKITL